MKQGLAKQDRDRYILFYVKESEKASLTEMKSEQGLEVGNSTPTK